MTFSSDFTLGLEEELLLVDPEPPHGLRDEAERVAAALDLPPGTAGHEAYAAEMELRTPVCSDAAEAAAALGQGRAALLRTGVALMGSGTHPTARWGDARLVDEPRYQRVRSDMRGLIQRTPECALHVHVGMPDAETAVVVLNALREWLPLLQALSANSPYWFGEDSGLASARWALVRAYPGRGVPAPLRDFAQWEERMEAAKAAGGFADYTHVWWDVRLHPRHGTVEVREMDAQAELEDVATLASLVHHLARRAAEAGPRPWQTGDALSWSQFRAARDGIAAEVVDDHGDVRPVADIAGALAREPGLEGLRRILERGGGAGGQRAAGSPRAAAAELVRLTR